MVQVVGERFSVLAVLMEAVWRHLIAVPVTLRDSCIWLWMNPGSLEQRALQRAVYHCGIPRGLREMTKRF
jgi:hypothetical protein